MQPGEFGEFQSKKGTFPSSLYHHILRSHYQCISLGNAEVKGQLRTQKLKRPLHHFAQNVPTPMEPKMYTYGVVGCFSLV